MKYQQPTRLVIIEFVLQFAHNRSDCQGFLEQLGTSKNCLGLGMSMLAKRNPDFALGRIVDKALKIQSKHPITQ